MEDIKEGEIKKPRPRTRDNQYRKQVGGYISVGLPTETLEKIRILAESRGQSSSAMVTFILCEYFHKAKVLDAMNEQKHSESIVRDQSEQ